MARYTGDHRSIFRKRYAEMITRISLDLASRCIREWITHRNWRWFAPGAQIAAQLLGVDGDGAGG